MASVSMSFVKSTAVKTKTLTEQFMVNPESHLKVRNHSGSIEFINTDDVEARIEATIRVVGKTEVEIEKMLEQFELNVNVAGSVIDVTAETNVDSWVQYNSFFYKKNTITFNDGSTAVDITEKDVSLVIYLPKVKELSVSSKYDDVKFETFNSDVNMQLFSSNLIGGDIAGEVDIDLKYGEINIGNIQDGKFEIFDSEIVMKKGSNLEINSKYSNFVFEDVNSLKLSSFDDEFKFGNIQGDLDFEAKYTEAQFGNFENAELDVFDCDIKGGGGKSMSIKSKYSTHIYADLEAIKIDFFQDDLDLGEVNEVNVADSKYSQIEIKTVNESFLVKSSHDDEITVRSVGDSISNVELDSKYTNLSFPIPSQVAYHLDAKLRYCTFEYANTSDIETKIENGSSLELICKVNNPNVNSTKVEIDAYSGHIEIQ